MRRQITLSVPTGPAPAFGLLAAAATLTAGWQRRKASALSSIEIDLAIANRQADIGSLRPDQPHQTRAFVIRAERPLDLRLPYFWWCATTACAAPGSPQHALGMQKMTCEQGWARSRKAATMQLHHRLHDAPACAADPTLR